MSSVPVIFFLPAIKYQNTLIENIRGLEEIELKKSSYSNQKQILERISEHISVISDQVSKMIDARKKANALQDIQSKSHCLLRSGFKEPYFDKIRYNVDKLELLIDDSEWLLPKYREILFLR